MKKATNSKNRGKISKLFPIMQEHLGQSMNLARIKLMTLLLEALVKAQTVNLVRLANAMDTAADKESNMRRLQRFLARKSCVLSSQGSAHNQPTALASRRRG